MFAHRIYLYLNKVKEKESEFFMLVNPSFMNWIVGFCLNIRIHIVFSWAHFKQINEFLFINIYMLRFYSKDFSLIKPKKFFSTIFAFYSFYFLTIYYFIIMQKRNTKTGRRKITNIKSRLNRVIDVQIQYLW